MPRQPIRQLIPRLGRLLNPELIARPSARVALALCCWLFAGAVRAQVDVHTDFDLAGWSRAGVVTLSSAELPNLWMDRLIDGSRRSTVVVEGQSLVHLSLDFEPPQYVRKAGLRLGNDDEYEVVLAAVDSEDNRFAFGQKVISDGEEALFRPIDATLSRIEWTVENLTVDPEVRSVEIAEVRVGGRITVLSLDLEGVPASLPKGGLFPVRVIGLDSYGGHPDLTTMSQLAVTPRRALKERSRSRVEARIAGAIAIAPRLDSLEGQTRHLLVSGPGPAPEAPTVFKGSGTIELALQGDPPFEISRRKQGEKQRQILGTAWSQRFLDNTIEAGTAYLYSIRRLDRFGNQTSAVSDETRVRAPTRAPPGQIDIGRLPVLVVLYADSMEPGEPEAIVESLERARRFRFVHSGCRLLIDNTYLWMAGPTPDTSGPSMDAIGAQLEQYGVPDDAFGVVYVVANDLVGAHGNFEIMGGLGGAMGRGPGVPTPAGVMGPDPAVAWVFLHELNHVLAGRIAASVGRTDLASGDLAQDFRFGPLGTGRGRPLDLGEAWDGLAVLSRDSDFWDDVSTPFRQPLEVLDSDGDGLPDEDPRLPIDEARFGSDPALADSDGDGLSDVDELRAGLYQASDPLRGDSDGDGLADGQDPWPLSDFSGEIPYGETPVILARGPRSEQPQIVLAGCWTEDALTLSISTPFPGDVFIDLDGSGAFGRWESDVIVEGPGLPSASDVWAGPARLALRAAQEPLGVFIGGRRLEGVIPELERLPGANRLTVRLPAALGPGARDATTLPSAPTVAGLRLHPGTVLGLAVTVRPSRPSGSPPFDAFAPSADQAGDQNQPPQPQPWISLFETHRLYDAVLSPAREPDEG